jgi:hypothetical protein
MVYASILLTEKLRIIRGKWENKITPQNMNIFYVGVVFQQHVVICKCFLLCYQTGNREIFITVTLKAMYSENNATHMTDIFFSQKNMKCLR